MIEVRIDNYTAHNERKMREIILPMLKQLAIDASVTIEVTGANDFHITTLVSE